MFFSNQLELGFQLFPSGVIAIGTLLAFGVDVEKAWDVVHKANMAKEVGTKPERPNPLGLPDLMKPEGWENPSHNGNYGNLPDNI